MSAKRQEIIDPAVAAMLEQGAKRKGARRKSDTPKADWQQFNTRLPPTLKQRLKARAQEIGAPLEELVYVALMDFLDRLESGEVELNAQPVDIRKTLL